jgi:hypothetical protein
MALKPDGCVCPIREQIIDDPVTGLTIQFEVVDDGSARVRLVGDALPFGNREFAFDADGREVGAGVSVAGACRPSWLREVKR